MLKTEVSNTQKTVKGLFSQSFVTIALGIVELLSFSIMSRLLTKQDFGYYAAIMAIVTVFSSFSETGIGAAIIQKQGIDKRFINNAFTLSLLLGGLISLLLFVLSGILSENIADASMQTPLMLMSITLLLHCLTSVNVSLMYRKLQFYRVGFINLFASVATTAIAIILAINDLGYYAILSKAVLTSILVWGLTLHGVKYRYQFCADIQTLKSILSYSGWLMVSVVFRNLSQQIDRLLMPKLFSVALLGAYNRPKDFIGQISNKLNGIFDTVLFPVLSGIQNDKAKLSHSFRESLYTINLFSTLLSLFFICNANLLIRLFFGEQWINLAHVFQLFSASVMFNADGRLADCYMRSIALTKQQFYFRILETFMKLVGVLTGAKWGLLGIATAVVLSDIMVKIIKISFVAIRIEIPLKEVFSTLFSSWHFILFMLPIGIPIYFLLCENTEKNIILAILFFAFCGILFLLFPASIGKKYKVKIHPHIIQTINQKVLHRSISKY